MSADLHIAAARVCLAVALLLGVYLVSCGINAAIEALITWIRRHRAVHDRFHPNHQPATHHDR